MSVILEPQSYGATPGTGDNTSALNAWFTALMSTTGAQGLIAGHYPYASPLVWDFNSRPSRVKIAFEPGVGRLQYTGSTGKALQLIRSGGSSVGSKSVYGLLLENLEIDSDHSGVTFQIGSDNGYDVFESCRLPMARVINNNTSGVSGAITAIACRLVGMNAPVFDAPIFNCKAATNNTTAKGSGISLELVMVICGTFNSPSPSNGSIGIHYTNLGNSALGFIHGNVFNGPDFENLENAIVSETTNGAVGWDTYIGGTVDLVGGGYPMTLKTGSGFFGGAIPSASLNWVCPPWCGNTSGVIKNPSYVTTGISVIVS